MVIEVRNQKNCWSRSKRHRLYLDAVQCRLSNMTRMLHKSAVPWQVVVHMAQSLTFDWTYLCMFKAQQKLGYSFCDFWWISGQQSCFWLQELQVGSQLQGRRRYACHHAACRICQL